jgi:hypothetical protein
MIVLLLLLLLLLLLMAIPVIIFTPPLTSSSGFNLRNHPSRLLPIAAPTSVSTPATPIILVPIAAHSPHHHPPLLAIWLTLCSRFTLAVELTSKAGDVSSTAPYRDLVTTGEIVCPTIGTDGLLLLSDASMRCVVASPLALGRIENVRIVVMDKQQQQQTDSSSTPANGAASSSPAASSTPPWSLAIASIDVRSLPNGKTLQFSLPSAPPLSFPLHSSLLLPCVSGPNATIRYAAPSSSSSSSSSAAAASATAAPATNRPLFGLKSYTSSLNPLTPVQAVAAPYALPLFL